MPNQFHQPSHPFFAAWAERCDNFVIAQPGCKRLDVSLTGVSYDTKVKIKEVHNLAANGSLTLKPSERGELEISDVNNRYLEEGLLSYDILEGWWTDAGTPLSLALANRLSEHVVLSVLEESPVHRVGASELEKAAGYFELARAEV